MEASPHGGVDATFPAWAADRRNQSLGQGRSPGDEKEYMDKVPATKDGELSEWSKIKVFSPVKDGAPI